MTDHKHHPKEPQPEEEQEAAAAKLETPGRPEAPLENREGNEIEALKQKLAELEAKSTENLDGWQRAVAEFQNYKKRLERDREADKSLMKGDLIRNLLPILDDLERALQNRPAEDAWANGIELIARKLQAIFEAEGIKRIEAEGAEFDPNYHEAISYEPAEGVESGHVIAVVQNGYMLGERVVRPAMVRVAK